MMLSNKAGRPIKYNFTEMHVGEEQFHPVGEKGLRAHQRLILTAAANQVGCSGKFKTRCVQIGGQIGVKIKRVAQ